MKKLVNKVIVVLIAFAMLFSTFDGLSYAQPKAYAQETSVSAVDNQNFHGFKLVSEKNYPGLKSDVLIYEHIKTGAKLMYVKNDDTQRAFSISFRTPAVDDTGVNHIIEHSVLEGSKNYPVKSPFQEMVKSSLGTFINAMTAQDYTSFPVASSNEQDLKNLMSVYLDAVFNPNVLTDDNIFKQEGWRYELASLDAPITINGIVYNEMKGYYSDPTQIMTRAVSQSLFPDTTSKWESGGNPDVIPTLTKEHLVDTYKKNYNPSNSYIYLYGKLDIGSYLDYIDQNYLSKYDKQDNDTSIKAQKPLSEIADKTVSYSVSKLSNTNNKTYLSLNFVTGNIEDKEKNIALSLLDYLLTGTDDSPVKKAITDAGIAGNFSSSFNMSGKQSTYSFVAANSNETSKDVFKKTIMDTLQKIAKNGFDKDFLNAAIDSYNISKRSEALFTPSLGGKGLNLSDLALAAWIYDLDPTMYFDSSDVEKKIMDSDSNSYFQNLIKECFLNNSQHSMVIVKPEKGLETQKTEDQKKALAEYKDQLGTEGCKALVEATEAYDKWENRTDSKEALATLPRLSLKDVTPELPDLTYHVDSMDGAKVLTHNTDLNGFSSISMYFDTSGVPQKQLPYLTLLSSLLGNISTANYTSQQLSNEMAGCMVSPVVFAASSVVKNSYDFSPKMTASMIVPDEKISQASTIVNDILSNTKFTDKKKIKEYIKQTESGLQMIYGSNSGYLAAMNLNAYMSEGGKYNNQLAGEAYYKFLKDLDKNFDSRWKQLSKNLKAVYKLAFNKNGLIVSHSGSESSGKEFKAGLGTIIKKLNSKKIVKQKYKFTKTTKNVAYSTSGKVQTVIQAGKLTDEKIPFSGKMLVLQNILNTGYLWDKIRTSGGAYTVGSSFSMDGTVMFYSQSDPNLKETLKAFAGTADYLRSFTATDDEMSYYIIGAVKDFVNLKSSGAISEGALCDSMYLTGMTVDDLLKVEKEALSTTAQDIRGYADMIDKIIKQNIYFVEGSKDKIDQDKDLFKKVITVKY